ncbi:MAG TPA: hypothetical protein PLU35_13975, partial [Phycisphaerales bacterium]|nr:hypothetical protein [Phycisphaerales bacterium]
SPCFNCNGFTPDGRIWFAGGMGIGTLLDACKQAAASNADFRWADAAFLREQGVSGWSDMPVWLPPEGDTLGFGQRSC